MSVLICISNERARQLHFISVSVLARLATGRQKKKEKEKAVANVEDMKKKKKELWACDPCKVMFFFFHNFSRSERYLRQARDYPICSGDPSPTPRGRRVLIFVFFFLFRKNSQGKRNGGRCAAFSSVIACYNDKPRG